DVGLMAGGLSITSMLVASGCKSGPGTTAPSTTPPTSNPTTTPSNTSTTTPTPATSGNGGYVYIPVMEYGLMEIEGCTSKVADDRMYASEHTWVKVIEGNIVAVGITDKMALLTDIVKAIELPSVGGTVTRNESFAYAEGAKMSVELICPVSGAIILVNNAIHEPPYGYAEVINKSPYVNGWLLVVELSKPEELDELLTPLEYAMENRKVT
ncbi:MAG: hypothetical protein JW954_07410, partial [Dehalococcoidaceae bacterium]|nr:hypothetical protein [Dehalococcoidaceae bacterium]